MNGDPNCLTVRSRDILAVLAGQHNNEVCLVNQDQASGRLPAPPFWAQGCATGWSTQTPAPVCVHVRPYAGCSLQLHDVVDVVVVVWSWTVHCPFPLYLT